MLAYEHHGDRSAPPVTFLHGFLGSCGDWDAVVDALLEEYQCIVVDLPGHGESRLAHGAPAPGIAATADAVLEIWDALCIEKSTVVGYSMGGRLGLYLTLQHPGRVARAAIESASPGLRSELERAARRKRDEAIATALEDSPMEAFLRWWYAQPLFETLHADPVRFERLIHARVLNDPFGLAASLRAMGTGSQPSMWDWLGQNRVPLRLIAGEFDEKYSGIARAIRELAPHSSVDIVPGCGHNVHFEKPAEYTLRLQVFLERE